MADSMWTCSNAYNDKHYALTFCPYKIDKCGDKNIFQFTNIKNISLEVSVANLSRGESCTYEINSTKGALAFSINNYHQNVSNKINLTYIEYSQKFLNSSNIYPNLRDNSKNKSR